MSRQFSDLTHNLASIALEAAQLGAWEVLIPGPALWDKRTRELHGADLNCPINADTARSYVHPDDRAELDRAVIESISDGGSGFYQAEYRVNNSEPVPRWIKVSARAITKDGVMTGFRGVVQDITISKQHDCVRDFLAREAAHRTSNILSIVQGLASRTFSHPDVPQNLLAGFQERLRALACSQQVFSLTNNDLTADLRQIITNCATPFFLNDEVRLFMDGPSIKVDAEQTVAVTLVLHELMTNAIKYGALSNSRGCVRIVWDVEMTSYGPMLKLRWEETGGPLVQEPKSRGFGTSLITGVLNYGFHSATKARLIFNPTGIVCLIDIVLSKKM